MPPAFLFLIPAMSNNLGRSLFCLGGTICPASEVAAYMVRRIPRQHPFLRFLQRVTVACKTYKFNRRTLHQNRNMCGPIRVGVSRREAAYMGHTHPRQLPFLRFLQ